MFKKIQPYKIRDRIPAHPISHLVGTFSLMSRTTDIRLICSVYVWSGIMVISPCLHWNIDRTVLTFPACLTHPWDALSAVTNNMCKGPEERKR